MPGECSGSERDFYLNLIMSELKTADINELKTILAFIRG